MRKRTSGESGSIAVVLALASVTVVRFEGEVGGCNVGAVSGSGGQITVFGRR